MIDRVTKMVNGLLPDGTLIRACEVTFDYLEKQDDRIAKLESALQEFIDPCIEHCFGTCQSECDPMKDCPCFKARKALEGKDD